MPFLFSLNMGEFPYDKGILPFYYFTLMERCVSQEIANKRRAEKNGTAYAISSTIVSYAVPVVP
jgi:hypothetical protein